MAVATRYEKGTIDAFHRTLSVLLIRQLDEKHRGTVGQKPYEEKKKKKKYTRSIVGFSIARVCTTFLLYELFIVRPYSSDECIKGAGFVAHKKKKRKGSIYSKSSKRTTMRRTIRRVLRQPRCCRIASYRLINCVIRRLGEIPKKSRAFSVERIENVYAILVCQRWRDSKKETV